MEETVQIAGLGILQGGDDLAGVMDVHSGQVFEPIVTIETPSSLAHLSQPGPHLCGAGAYADGAGCAQNGA